MEKLKPLKKFGQNYLTDPNILRKIVEEINPAKDDNIIEIGPGRGVLTQKLLEKTSAITAVEIDRRVIGELSGFKGLNLIEGDFLETDLEKIYKSRKKKLRITGNIPYNLTSPIIFKLIENHRIINDAVLMVQYEVARRITAVKGTKDYGILSILLNYFSEVKFCFKVSPNVFYPKPKVYSAVVHIYLKEETPGIDDLVFIQIVKASFGNRRKTLKNSLSNSIFKEINFSQAGIDLSLRAEQLDLKDFIRLAEFASNQFKPS